MGIRFSKRFLVGILILFLVLSITSICSYASSDDFTYSVSAEIDDANALFNVGFFDASDELFYVKNNVASYTRTIYQEDIDIGMPPYVLSIKLASYDEESYSFVGWSENGVINYTTKQTISYEYSTKEALQSISIVAIFQKKGNNYNCTPVVSSSNVELISLSGDSLEHINENEDTNTSSWKLTADCKEGFELRYIQIGDDETSRVDSEDGYTITWEVTEDGAEYTAYFGNAVPHIGEVYVNGSPKPGLFTGNPVTLRVPWSKGSTISQENRTIYADVYYVSDDTVVVLGSATASQNVDVPGASSNTQGFTLTIDPIPEDMSEFTVRARFGENGELSCRTFDAAFLGIQQSGSTSLDYLDVPGGGMGPFSTSDNGPVVYDMAAFVDGLTGDYSTYFATNGGLVRMAADGSFEKVSSVNGFPVAVGGADEDHLCVLTAAYAGSDGNNGSTQYLIWQYDADENTWQALSDQSYTRKHGFISGLDGGQAFDPVACVIAEDSIWVKDAHWNGAAWSANVVTFNSFWKDGSDAFAGSADGVYRYASGEWTKLSDTSGTMYVVAGARSGDTVTLLTADTYEPEYRMSRGSINVGVRGGKQLTVSSDGAVTVTSVDTDAFVGTNGSSLIGMGVNCAGDIFAFQSGRSYNGNQFGAYTGSFVYKLTDGKWVNQLIPEFNDDKDQANIDAGTYPGVQNDVLKSRPDGVRYSLTPTEGMTYFLGLNGAIYADYGKTTITFDSKGGSSVSAITKKIGSEVVAPAKPSQDGMVFDGWYYDEEFIKEWDAYDAVMPAKDITLYAKWSEAGSEEELLALYKTRALAALEKQYDKYSSTDYTSENWSALQSAYIAGMSAINKATAGTEHIEDNVTAALNAAIAAMREIPVISTSEITVAVSMDANTLGLGFILEPALVTVDKGTPVSVVLTDLLSQQAEAKYGVTADGRTDDIDPEIFSTPYPWVSDGKPTYGFYLSQVYFPEQTNYCIPTTIQDYITANNLKFDQDDANGNYLGEFDYMQTSGWVYSVGDKDGEAEFPGVGANCWGLSNGEVVRWQFTLVGYGADLGADNTAWGTNNIVTVGDKSALTWKVAELRSQYSDDVLKAENVYTDALSVLTDAEATEDEIDAALEALNNLTFKVPVTAISLNLDKASVSVGGTLTLTATVEPENATDKTVSWESSDPETATVSNGVVTGVKAGVDVTITAKAGEMTATCVVTVTEEAAEEVTIHVTENKGAPVATVTSTVENGMATIHVEADKPCVVVVKKGDTYKRLGAVANGEGYDFSTSDYSSDLEFFVMLRGDYNGDGSLDGSDIIQAKAALLKKLDMDPLGFFTMDMDADDKLDGSDIIQAKAVLLKKRSLDWLQ